MLKQFKVKVHIIGHYAEEDPKCPPEWRGSGCYDIEYPAHAHIEVEVWADDKEQARRFAAEYQYLSASDSVEMDDVKVESVQFVKDLPNRYSEEAGVIDPDRIKW